MKVKKLSSDGKSASLPGMPAQNKVGQSTVLWRGVHSIEASWLPVSFLMRFNSSASSPHAITLKWARTEVRPKLCASFRYSSIHSRLMALAREYLESDCILRADFSKRFRFSSLLSMKMYWLYRWLHDNSRPSGLANDRRQSLRSVDILS